MPAIHSFAPIVGPNARILILGSMPGEASLAAHQYYAHRRNAFWPIMAALLKIDADAPYHQKVTALLSSPFALWDVLKSCERTGSLDNMIRTDNFTLNDFASLFSSHEQIGHVFFNGGTAERYFTRYALSASILLICNCRACLPPALRTPAYRLKPSAQSGMKRSWLRWNAAPARVQRRNST